jgi:hypothetical protein
MARSPVVGSAQKATCSWLKGLGDNASGRLCAPSAALKKAVCRSVTLCLITFVIPEVPDALGLG